MRTVWEEPTTPLVEARAIPASGMIHHTGWLLVRMSQQTVDENDLEQIVITPESGGPLDIPFFNIETGQIWWISPYKKVLHIPNPTLHTGIQEPPG